MTQLLTPRRKNKNEEKQSFSTLNKTLRTKKREAVALRQSKKEKSGCSLPKGIEHPLALLYNLIARKNPQESEIIIQQ